MTKKVTLDKTEYDEMEKEIERLKSINEELVKGASVVIEPNILINPYIQRFTSSRINTLCHIVTTREDIPNHTKLQDLWEELEDKIQNELDVHIQKKLASLEKKKEDMKLKTEDFNKELENKIIEVKDEIENKKEDLRKKEQDFKNTRRVSLKNQENERKRLKEEYDKKVALFEKQKQGYESRPIKRYVLSGALLALLGNYILGLL